MDGFVLEKNHLLKCWGWLSLLNWTGTLALSILLKLPPRKLEPWLILRSFFLLRLFCISINLPYGHVWNTVGMSGRAGAHSYYLGLLDKLQKPLCRTVGASLLPLLSPWTLICFHSLTVEGVLLVILIDCMIFLSPFLHVTRMSMSTVSFLAQLESEIICLLNAFLWRIMALSLELTDTFYP